MLATSSTHLAEDMVYQPPPQWVKSVLIPTANPAPGPAAETLLINEQLHLTATADESFVETAIRINSPAGLAQAGNIIETWNPLTESLIANRVQIIRAGKVIDLLGGGNRFTVLRREANLETSMIDGTLTATLQPEGLQVGDVLDLAVTLRRHEPALDGHSEAALTLAHAGVVKRFYVKASWPIDHPISIWKTDDMGPLAPHDEAGWRSVGYDLKDSITVDPPEGAPLRDQLRGVVQFSGFKDWSELSQTAYARYDTAATLGVSSPLKDEIARLRAASQDPKARTLAALQFVEDKVRYFYVGLEAGGYIPASADQTWARRFGDCKGKSVLLLALLHGLGIEAEPVLVSTQAGDGLDRRLPQMAAFDHVLVRVEIAGRSYWLDGTRMGDANLDLLTTPNMHWTLPLRRMGASLEPLRPDPVALPQVDKLLKVDLRAGIDRPGPAHMEITLRGDGALGMNLIMKQASPADADHSLRKMFESVVSWVKADKVAFTYDPMAGVAHLTLDGSGVAPFTGTDPDKEWWVDLSSLGWDANFRRTTTYHADAPYTVDYPDFQRFTVEARLPAQGQGFQLGNAGPLSQTTAGRAYRRSASLTGDRMVMTASDRAVEPEFPAAEAAQAQSALHELSLHDVVLQLAPKSVVGTISTPTVDSASHVQSSDALSPQQSARQAFADKDYIRAEAQFSQAIALDPTSAKLFYDRGAARLALNQQGPAKADFEAALKINPKDAFAHFALGRMALSKGDIQSAEQHFMAAINAATDPHAMVFQTARAYDETNHLPQAVAAYRAWTTAEPNTERRAQGLNLSCSVEARLGADLRAALSDCNQAVALRRDFTAALDSRGLVNLKMGAFSSSVSDYDKALALKPDIATSLYGRGIAKRRLGRAAEGDRDIGAGSSLDPEVASRFDHWGVRP